MASMDDKPKTKRRWFRFSLRTLLLLVTIASAGFGLLGVKMRAKQRERDAVNAIHEFGGRVYYDYEWYSANRAIILRSSTPPGPAFLRRILGNDLFAKVTLVDIRTKPAEASFRQLAVLNELEGLCLCNVQVTEASLVHLKGLKRLKCIELGNSRITDTGVDELQKALPSLKVHRD